MNGKRFFGFILTRKFAIIVSFEQFVIIVSFDCGAK